VKITDLGPIVLFRRPMSLYIP